MKPIIKRLTIYNYQYNLNLCVPKDRAFKLKAQAPMCNFPLYPKSCYQGFWNLQTTKYVNMKRLAWAPNTFWNTKLGYDGAPVLLSVTSWKSGTSPKVNSFSQKSIVLKSEVLLLTETITLPYCSPTDP